jgi:hypothetical protein
MRFVTYLSCLPKKGQDTRKAEVLTNFSRGVVACKDELILHNGNNLVEADVGMILGYVHEDSKNTPHLQLRKNILEYQASRNKHTVIADSNLFLYKNPDNPKYYLRYSFDGVFPNTGIYCDSDIDPSRWTKLSRDIGLSLKDYRTNGGHILLCLQRNGGWSMGGFDVLTWTARTIAELRKHTDREIVIRAHPGDKGAKDYLHPKRLLKSIGFMKKVRVSNSKSLLEDLNNCWAVINHNSSPTVGAAIEGYPIFVTDPEKSQSRDIANTDLSKIEDPVLFDRQQWVERLSMFHWCFDETISGECWNHMRRYI